MELDNLRRQWQQSVPAATAPAIPDAAELARLLARASATPVAKMRRNAWLEIAVVVAGLAGSGIALLVTRDGYYLAMAAWLGLVCVLSGFYFHRKLAVLRSFDAASSGAVRAHMQQQLNSLRSLLKLYYQATMWSIPASCTVGMVALGWRMAQRLSGEKLLLALGALAVGYLLVGTLIYFGIRRFTTWYLQRLYGQHLDRLTGQLRELDEPAA